MPKNCTKSLPEVCRMFTRRGIQGHKKCTINAKECKVFKKMDLDNKYTMIFTKLVQKEHKKCTKKCAKMYIKSTKRKPNILQEVNS